MARLVYWIYVVICLVSGKKIEKMSSGWILLDIFMFSLAAYLYDDFMFKSEREKREYARLKELSQITLSAPQTVAGIAMPAGTYLETEIAKRKQSEPDKFTYAKFPRPVVWNGIPITSIRRLLSNNDNYWDDYKIETNPEKPARIGQWLCAGKDLEWRLIPQANGKPPEIPYNQSAEPYVYLSRCDLEEGQFASLPEFGAMLEVSSISRENDKYRDAAKGFWRAVASRYSEESRESGIMDFRSLEMSVDTARMVHEFAAKLEDNNPDMNCQIPEHTFLVWQKSRPNVILAASPEPKRIPKKCWGKTLVPTPIEALSKQLGPNYESFFNGAEQYFKQTQAVSSKQKNFEKP
ncbi:hypothetical protein [Kingella denitrificans]|uniref:hypothetical protein n=1 Tax=Kingella denitrificans TaxID=502 RepID=UPI00288B1CBA|nr:hypothetical protein [Kingella denitrificans]